MFIEVVDGPGGVRFTAELIGAASLPASVPAPLAVLSHGNGGSYQIYRALCATLAAGGWLVAGFDHPGNNRRDDRLQDSRQNLEDRPRHVGLLIDTLVRSGRADARRIAVMGHSLGACTALAVAGAKGWTRDGVPLSLQADPRVGALVLLAPAAFWFTAPGALAAVHVPILMLQAELDRITPLSQGDVILDGVPDRHRVTSLVEPGAGHFSFISPYPPAMRRPEFPPANDPEGFDREAFHRRYPGQVLAWLNQVLPAPAR